MGTVVASVFGLEAGETAKGADGFLMEPGAVGVERCLDEVFIPWFGAEIIIL